MRWAFIALLVAGCAAPVGDDVLAERAASCQVDWNNYDEDIKAQIGAEPTAAWTGQPVSALRNDAAIGVTFRLEGAWAQRKVAMPMLMRDPLANVVRETEVLFGQSTVTYRFDLDSSWSDGAVPWVEIQYPHHETRIAFRQDGTWTAHRDAADVHELTQDGI